MADANPGRWYSIFFCSLLMAGAIALRFPKGFKFGAATAAYQTEGGWNASDKSESIWDHLLHRQPDLVRDHSSGDVACDSYHLWKEDVKLAVELGLDFYRFSISWPRLLPSGFSNYISEDGSKFYSNLIDELIAHGIEPVVTLYHWDLPQSLQDLGGWANPLIADWFTDYARVTFDLYADRVKTWLTVNEPIIVCDIGFDDFFAPKIASPNFGAYLCNKNILISHARAYRLYEKEYKPKYKGQVSLSNQNAWYEPKTPSDVQLTELSNDHTIGRYSDPIFSARGGWPPALEDYIARKSKWERYPRSRLPPFSQEEIELVRGSYDFYGMNFYTARTVSPGRVGGLFMLDTLPELDARLGGRPDWPTSGPDWLVIYPESLRHMLNYVKKRYGDVKILITENGYTSRNATIEDTPRVDYFRSYLGQLLLAMEEDGVNVVGYTAWSLMDNFEWMHGYTSYFGLAAVNFSSPRRTRTARRSARYFAHVARTHDIDATEHLET